MGIKPGLERITLLLEALGNPQQDIKVVQVAGTNGKGSTSLMIARILSASGYRSGRYSSPHLHSYCERFEIDDRVIMPGQLLAYLETVLAAANRLRPEDFPTEFEILTAVAFLYFKQEQVDIAVLETGMGGSYDATTAALPCLCVITSIDYDHMAFLGETLAEIAVNKAGIIKPGVPVVVGKMEAEARQVIEARAGELNSPVRECCRTRIAVAGPQDLSGQWVDIKAGQHQLEKVWLSLPGRFQLGNLSCALTALTELEKISFVVTDEYIKSALGKLHSTGRLEVLSHDPLIICDVAHNPQAARALDQALKELLPGREKVLLVGMLDDKDAAQVLNILGNGSAACVVTRPAGPRSQNWRRCGDIMQQLFPAVPCTVEPDIARAAELSRSILGKAEYLLVTGSFFVIDQARQYLLSGPRVM